MKRLIFLPILVGLMCGACSRKSPMDAGFEKIDMLCDTDPHIAMSMLDSIDYGALSTADRHRYDLLSIKSRDKAYVRHSSDSLILDVVEYYDGHSKSGLYPEALYYGGRVYSDIGDLPTALSYFQNTIDVTPDDKEHRRFRRNVMDQTGRLLQSLRLDSAAIRYLEKSLILNDILKENDSRVAFTHVLLGSSYRNIHDISNARLHIDKAISKSCNLSAQRQASVLLNLADILAYEGKLDSALNVIRPLPSSVDSLALSQCLALASEIYRDAGILDTAYMYARQLTKLKDPSNKRTGYKVIFSEKLRNQVSKDTLIALISEYKSTIEEYVDNHEGENAIVQNTRYNYGVHERERRKAEKKLYIYALVAAIAVILSLILLSLILYRKFRKVEKAVSIATAINFLKDLPFIHFFAKASDTHIEEEEITSMDLETHGGNFNPDNAITENVSNTYPDYMENEKIVEIKKRILSGIESSDDMTISSLVNPAIRNSQTYRVLLEKVNSKDCITLSEEEIVFKDLEKLIESVSNGFSYRLRILTEDKITPSENRVAMLIKCGFTPLQTAVLLGKQKNTISSHRRNLAFKITGQKKADRSLDLIIISL